MALNTVVVTWDETDPALAGVSGGVTFALSGTVADTSTGTVVSPEPKTYAITQGTGQSDPLVANDNASLSPSGSYYMVTIDSLRTSYRFTAFLNHANGATQTLASLIAAQAQPIAQFAQYLLLPSGTPSAGQVPAATGAGEASAWTTLTAGLVGADPAGAATASAAYFTRVFAV